MREAAFGSLFVVLFLMVIAWFVLVSWLFRRLRERHARIYEEMGSPTLFLNNSIRNNWLFMKFLWGGGWRALGDPQLTQACQVMQVFFVVYLVVFVSMMFVLPRPH